MNRKYRTFYFSIFDVYEYMLRGMTLKEIAQEKQCSVGLVQKRLKEMGIKRKWRRTSKYPLPKNSPYIIEKVNQYKKEIENTKIILDFEE